MADAPTILPEAIDVQRTKFEGHARDRPDKIKRTALMLMLVDVALVAATFVVALLPSTPSMEPWIFALLVALLPVSALVLGAWWLHAHLQRKHYDSRAESTWTLRCHDTGHEWRIEGIGPASAWRDVSIKCKELPRHKDKLIASPKLHVRIDNEQGVLKSGHLQKDGENTLLFVIDKEGLPIGITIGHIDPGHASEEEPWVVEFTLFGDADALEKLLAWPVARHRDGPDDGGETGQAKRQA